MGRHNKGRYCVWPVSTDDDNRHLMFVQAAVKAGNTIKIDPDTKAVKTIFDIFCNKYKSIYAARKVEVS
jgi:hypothetical protein